MEFTGISKLTFQENDMMRILAMSLALACGAVQECGAMDLLSKPLPGELTSDYGFAVHKDFKASVRGQ